jgi:hypothetical protein
MSALRLRLGRLHSGASEIAGEPAIARCRLKLRDCNTTSYPSFSSKIGTEPPTCLTKEEIGTWPFPRDEAVNNASSIHLLYSHTLRRTAPRDTSRILATCMKQGPFARYWCVQSAAATQHADERGMLYCFTALLPVAASEISRATVYEPVV